MHGLTQDLYIIREVLSAQNINRGLTNISVKLTQNLSIQELYCPLSPVSSSSYHVVTEAQVTRQAAQHRGHTVTVVKQAT